jgi:POT family proton-dependent oligopeptide transporter
MVNKLSPVKFASLLMGVWFLSTAAANKFAGVLSGLYPEPVIKTEIVTQVQDRYGINIQNKNAEVKDYNGSPCITMEMVNFTEAKDKAQKAEITKFVEQNSVVKAKSFLGFNINSLYSFFMIFVFMAGIASVILFFLSSMLLKMMHGIK